MNKTEIKIYPYRWVVLAVYSFISVIIQIQWLTFASISSAAQEFYHTSALSIDFLSIIYMLVFIVMSIPVSYIIDTWGLRKGLIAGAILTGVFGVMKAWGGNSLFLVTTAQIGLAAAQPFILNAVTKVGAKWFPVEERATAAGIGTLAQYAGIIIALAVTPILISETEGSYTIVNMLWVYGAASVLAALLIIVFMREEPPTPPSSEEFTKRDNPKVAFVDILKNREMQMLLLLFFIGLGIFNAVSTCIDQICKSLTMDETGMVGGIMLLGGVVGAVVLPTLSDKKRKRRPFIIISMILMLPGLIGLTVFTEFVPMLISAFFFGFFIMGVGPIGFQFGAEKSYPAPESTSQGIILLVGQISGIIFVFGVNKLGIFVAMLSFIVLTLFNVFLSTRLKESMSKFL